MKQAFERDGISPEQARATLEQWSKLGEKPEVLADLGGENVRALLSSITNLPGPARQQADEIFRLRQSYHSQRMLKDISEAGGVDARKFLDDIDALTAAQKEAAAPLYEKMDSVRFTLRETVGGEARRRSNTDAGDFLERFLGRQQIRKSVRLGKEIADADFEDQVVKELTAIARGEMPDTVSLKTLDYIKRGMDVRIRQVELNDKAKDLGRALKGLRANYRAIVDNLALREGYDYQAARNVYAGYAATQDAVELGRDAVSNKMMPDEIKRALSQMDGAEQEGFRRGFTRKLYEVFSTQPRNTDQTRKLRTDAMEEAMRVVFGDEADALVSNILRESNMIETARTASPRAGSQTARLAASMDDTAMSPDVASALENFATGRPISAGGSLLRGGIRRMNDAAMLPETKEELARLLLSPATPDATQQLALQRLIVLTNRSAAGRPSGALAGSTPEE
ncbi:MAG: hypothetical protein HRU11_12175 [Parvularculaceae bacterium]|nr:hypothetical protein [Parvularculaceae bacterium]